MTYQTEGPQAHLNLRDDFPGYPEANAPDPATPSDPPLGLTQEDHGDLDPSVCRR